jgi:hypothetical protein
VKRKPGTSPKGEPASEKGGTTGTGPRTENNTSQRIQKKEGGLWKGNQGGKDLIAAARHANWRERGTAEFEGKTVFAEGPHPAEPEGKRQRPFQERVSGRMRLRETRGLRLQDGYPMHMAELYALGIAIKSVAGQRGKNFNFVTDSRVALDMLRKRKGGAAHAILKEVERIETEGATVKLWWSSDRNRGIAEADRIAKRARENPEEFPEDHATITGRMIKKEATRVAMAKWQQEWDAEETVCHILQACPIAHDSRVHRHNSVATKIAVQCRKDGREVLEEPHVRHPDGTLYKPDLVVFRSATDAVVCDIQISWEVGSSST